MTINHTNPLSVISIDIGLDGGIAFNNTIISMPTIKTIIKPAVTIFARDSKNNKILIKSGPNKGQYKQIIKTPAKYKTEIDVVEFWNIFVRMNIKYFFIEKQAGIRGNSAVSNNTIGKNYGILLGAITILAEIEEIDKPYEITPQSWKKKMGVTKDKETSIIMAQKYGLKDIKRHDEAEAYLIGLYGLKELVGE